MKHANFPRGSDVRVHAAVEPMRHAGKNAGQARGRRGNDDGRVRGATESLAGGSVGRVTRLRELRAGDAEEARSAAGGDGACRTLDISADERNGERRSERGGEFDGGGQRFERGSWERVGVFGVGEKKNVFHSFSFKKAGPSTALRAGRVLHVATPCRSTRRFRRRWRRERGLSQCAFRAAVWAVPR